MWSRKNNRENLSHNESNVKRVEHLSGLKGLKLLKFLPQCLDVMFYTSSDNVVMRMFPTLVSIFNGERNEATVASPWSSYRLSPLLSSTVAVELYHQPPGT